MPPSATPAVTRLIQAGVPYRLHAYVLPARQGRARDLRPEYGKEAAFALGIQPGRMAKTLIVALDGNLVAAVIPVDRLVDLKALAATLGGRRADLADPAVAERAAGSVVGAISPLGMRTALPVVVEMSLLDQATVFVSAGRRGLQVELAPSDLVSLTRASVGAVSRSG